MRCRCRFAHRALAAHVPIDTTEDWSDVEINLPDVTPWRFWEELDESTRSDVRELLRVGFTDGYVSHRRLELLAESGDDWDADAMSRLLLVLGDVGIQVFEEPLASSGPLFPYLQDQENGSPFLDDSVAEAVTFLSDLTSAIGDPFNAYLKDIGRRNPLSKEEETNLCLRITEGIDKAISGICACEPALAELLRHADRVLSGCASFESMIDPGTNDSESLTEDEGEDGNGDDANVEPDADSHVTEPLTSLDSLRIRAVEIRSLSNLIFSDGVNPESEVFKSLTSEVKSLGYPGAS